MEKDDPHSWYKSLKESGDLLELFPNLTGKWAKDKKIFILYHEDYHELLDSISLDDDFVDDF